MTEQRVSMATLLSFLAVLSLVAGSSSSRADDPPAGDRGASPGPGWGPEGKRGGRSGMGKGGRGGSGWMRLASTLRSPESKLEVKEVDGGVSLTVTSTDKKDAEQIRKIAELIRANHEVERGDRERRKEARKKDRTEDDDGDDAQE